MCNLYDIGPARRSRTQMRQWEAEIDRLVAEIGRSYVASAGEGIVLRQAKGEWIPERMRWGFSRPWSPAINNAREDKLDRPTWADAWRSRRCLIPMTRFYEWSGSKGNKRKLAIRPDGGGDDWFYIGGLWEAHPDPSIGRSYTMLTTPANASMAAVHHRMPLILRDDERATFVGEDAPEALLEPFAGALSFESDEPEQFELDL